MAEMLNLTSADFKARLLTATTFPAGFDLESFADGDALTVNGVQVADLVKGVDDGAGYWYIPNVKEVSLVFMPGSSSDKNLSILAAAMDAKKAPDLIQMTVTIPSMKCSVVFIDGVLTSYPPIPGVSTRLQNVTYGFKFSRAQRMPL